MTNKKIVVTSFKTVDTLTSSGMIPAVTETLQRDLQNLRDKGFFAATIMFGLREGEQWTVFFGNECDGDEELSNIAYQFVKLATGE